MNLWQVDENTLSANLKKLHSQETVFTIGNGYFCSRGSFEEGYPRATPATLLFGVFDAVPIAKEELANAPDWTVIKLFVNGERFRLDRGTILDYHRSLNLRDGVLRRSIHWESPAGARVQIVAERFASLADEHIGIIRYSVTADNQNVELALHANIETRQGNYNVLHWETEDQGNQDDLLWLRSETLKTNMQLVQTMSFTCNNESFNKELVASDLSPSIRLYGNLAPGESVVCEKTMVMYTSRDEVDNPLSAALKHHSSLLHTPHATITMAQAGGAFVSAEENIQAYDGLLTANQAAWEQFWQVADVVLEGDDQAQLGLRYNLYQLRINVSAHDSRYSIAAKGLTGFGYRGHIFHDTEIFMLPFFTYVIPEIARNLLLYRYHLLPAARSKANHNGYAGAQYPWESTLNGEETTPPSIIHPETGEVIPVLNGQLELHITASIAHATWEYWRITGDDAFMRDYGAELLLSTAMFWVSRVEHNTARDDFEITNVIGPDEWHEHVDNNAFTNVMARQNIRTALEALTWLRSNAPDKATALLQQLTIDEPLLERWRAVAQHLRVPQDAETGLIEQFDGFFKLPMLDQSRYEGRKDSYQGLLGMEKVQKYQIIKQADVLMLLTVLNQEFDRQTKQVNWDYYYPITDHDYGSSLTPALHVVLASELGQTEAAYKLFMKGALVDLENLRGNTPDGIHTACAGAVWQAIILGTAGLRVTDTGYTTQPAWPASWTRLAFNFRHKGELVHVDLHR